MDRVLGTTELFEARLFEMIRISCSNEIMNQSKFIKALKFVLSLSYNINSTKQNIVKY